MLALMTVIKTLGSFFQSQSKENSRGKGAAVSCWVMYDMKHRPMPPFLRRCPHIDIGLQHRFWGKWSKLRCHLEMRVLAFCTRPLNTSDENLDHTRRRNVLWFFPRSSTDALIYRRWAPRGVICSLPRRTSWALASFEHSGHSLNIKGLVGVTLQLTRRGFDRYWARRHVGTCPEQ